MNKRATTSNFDDGGQSSTIPPKKRYRQIPTAAAEETTKNSDDISNTSDNEQSDVAIIEDDPKMDGVAKDSVAWKMMAKMGHKSGVGLGAKGQGRAEPIDVKMRSRRRGLGAESKNFEPQFDVKWDIDKEKITVEETPSWIPESNLDVPTADEMDGWIKRGPFRKVIDEETHFCDPDILADMLQSKTVFDELNDRDLRAARARANPFETIKGAVFQNRAAMKMANMDAVFDDLFTNPKIADDRIWVPKKGNDLYYFADVCAGPGGFSEYVLWRRGWSAHGFGMTLKGKDDFNLENFLAASPEMFEPHYGVGGYDGDGDATNPENLVAFKEYVLKQTGGQGVHLFMADGGFSVEGQENIQEILSKRLYLCQTLCAINTLRPGGNFVCKLFDVLTPFSVGLVYLLWRSFDRVCLHKPHTSRPANSERYIVCERLRDNVDAVREHLIKANLEYELLAKEGRTKDEDIEELVPLHVLKNEEAFFDYIKSSNEGLAARQTMYLDKYKAFAQNPNLEDHRQQDLRAQCLRYWKVPDEKRPPPPRCNPGGRMRELCGDFSWFAQGQKPAIFDPGMLDSASEQEYRVVLQTDKPFLLIALGKRFVFQYDPQSDRWNDVGNGKLSIPRDTILLCEMATEYKRKEDGQGRMAKLFLRVYDAYWLGGERISDKAYRERRQLIQKFCKAIYRESRPNITPVCLADAWHVEDIPRLRNRFIMGKTKGNRPVYRSHETSASPLEKVKSEFEYDLEAQGFVFYRILKDNWKFCYTRSDHRLYFFNTADGQSKFEGTPEAFNDLASMHASRKVWPEPKKRSNEGGGSPEEELLADLHRLADVIAERKRNESAASVKSDSS